MINQLTIYIVGFQWSNPHAAVWLSASISVLLWTAILAFNPLRITQAEEKRVRFAVLFSAIGCILAAALLPFAVIPYANSYMDDPYMVYHILQPERYPGYVVACSILMLSFALCRRHMEKELF